MSAVEPLPRCDVLFRGELIGFGGDDSLGRDLAADVEQLQRITAKLDPILDVVTRFDLPGYGRQIFPQMRCRYDARAGGQRRELLSCVGRQSHAVLVVVFENDEMV